MALSKLHTSVAAIGIAVAGAAAWWWQHRTDPPVAGGGEAALSGTSAGAAPSTGRVVAGAGTGAAAGGAARPAPVEVAAVEIMALSDAEVAVGTIASRRGVMLRPEVSGRVTRLNFKDGQPVKRGQLLVQLDDTLQQAQLKQAQAQAAIARTNLARNRDLLAANFVSQSAVDQSAAAVEVAESQVALARAQLARLRIVAPFDGVVGIRVVHEGDYLKDGADIVGLEDVRSVWVDFRLPERVIAKLRVGQGVDVSLDALPGRQFKGRVEAADAQVDANGRSLLVRAQLDNTHRELRSGMFARVRAVFDTRDRALVVPEEALVPLGNRQFLFKVSGEGEARTTERIEARLGLRVPGKVEIVSGLKAGDLVVTAGQARLMRGESLPVRIVELGKPAGGGAAPAPRAEASGVLATNGPGPAASGSGGAAPAGRAAAPAL